MEVYDREVKTIGRVLRIERYPANDVIVVGMKNNDIMIPAVREYVRNVDVKRKRMTVIIPEGLPTYPKGKL
jgi:16S rRNA processing protein RimM